jgi:hypothetical protein
MIRTTTSFLLFLCLVKPVTLNAGEAKSFQQRADHYCTIELDDVRHVIIGTDSMIYKNNSPDTLRVIYFHLWPNALQSGTALSEYYLTYGDPVLNSIPNDNQGSLGGLLFRFKGRGLRFEYHNDRQDLVRVDLAEPLLPGESININLMFRLQIPSGVPGELNRDKQAYFLSHWFPNPAVYGIDGWVLIPNHHQGRWLGESGIFEVSVTIPRNYIVVSSLPMMDNPEEEKFLQNLSDKTGKVNRWGKREQAGFPGSVAKTKTLQFRSNETHDALFCFDKRLHHLKDTLWCKSGDTLREIGVNLYFTVMEADMWSKSMPVIKEAFRFMELEAGDYPFESLTLIQTPWISGGRGYPGMIRLGMMMEPFRLEHAIIQGMADLWFNAGIHTNHYRHSWLHYGLPGFFANQYTRLKYPDTVSVQDLFLDPHLRVNLGGLKRLPFNRLDHYLMAFPGERCQNPLNLTPDQFAPRHFNADVSLRSTFALTTLAGSVGDTNFRNAVHHYFFNFCGHPAGAEDFLAMLHLVDTAYATRWFMESLLPSDQSPDYAITRIQKAKEGYHLTVVNRSNAATPFPLAAQRKVTETVVWHPGHQGSRIILYADSTHAIKRFTIDPHYQTTELFRRNNTIRTSGMFRKAGRLVVVPVVAIPDPERIQIQVAPVLGWNAANGFMAGLASYSNPIIRPETEYLLMPLYGFSNGKPAGSFKISHRFTPLTGKPAKAILGAEFRHYGHNNPHISLSYSRLMPFLEVQLNPNVLPSKGQHSVRFRSVIISRDREGYDTLQDGWTSTTLNYTMQELMWRYRVRRVINPFTLQAAVQQTGNHLRLVSENRFLISYPTPGKGFSVRFFGGVTLLQGDDRGLDTPIFTTAGLSRQYTNRTVIHDPWFDHMYLSRDYVTGLLRQHAYNTDGGFSRATTVGNNGKWLLSTNLSTTMPGILPFELCLDAALYGNNVPQTGFFSTGGFVYSTGIKVILWKNVAEIFLPFTFAESKEIAEREKSLGLNYFQKIRFTLNLHQLNPLTLPRKIRVK